MSAKSMFRVVGGIDFSAARDEKRSRAEARARARPILRAWLSRVENEVRAGKLAPVDALLAKELTNYPSANEGRCYAGQERLGAAVGRCARSARYSLKRLSQAGLLTSKRGGPGRTASWTFCINGQPVFTNAEAGSDRQFAALDRQKVAGLDRQEFADKPLEEDPLERKPSPQPPAAQADEPQGCRGEDRGEAVPQPDPALDGEVLGPEGDLTFEDLWAAIDGDQGPQGPALVTWRRLSQDDRQAIAVRLHQDQVIDTGGCWLVTWLRERRWEQPVLQRHRRGFGPGDGFAAAAWRHAAAEFRAAVDGVDGPRIRTIYRGTPEWNTYRAEMIARGESTKFFDKQGSWTLDGRDAG